ncbi:MAG: choice-of-anchor D domain-containing protein [Pseudomonadota bacterium]|nr:choice-of-anchor D domain-containing protein [Pseudomonadota bacterium]
MLLLLACVQTPDQPDRPDEVEVEPDPPALAVAPLSFVFGEVPLGEEASLDLSLTSEGGSAVTVAFAYEDDTLGFGAPVDPVTIAPGDILTVPLTFAPDSLRYVDTRLLVTSDDPVTSVLGIPVSGNGAGAILAATPAELDLGEVYLGCTATGTLEVTNRGNRVSSLDVAGLSDPVFTTDVATPQTLEPWDVLEVPVTFTPLVVGERTATLNVVTDTGTYALATVTGAAITMDPVTLVYVVPDPDLNDAVVVVDPSTLDRVTVPPLLETLAAGVAGTDLRVAILIADDGCVPGGFIDDATADPAAALAAMLAVEAGDYEDQGFRVVEAGTSVDALGPGGCNEGLLRDTARTALVRITDDGEVSPGSWAEWMARFETLEAVPDDLDVYAVAGDYPSGCEDAGAASGWYELSVASGGDYLSICATDVGDQLLEALIDEPWNKEIELTEWPDSATIVVTVDGVPMREGWTYQDADRGVEFDEDLPPGTVITITYTPAPSCR